MENTVSFLNKGGIMRQMATFLLLASLLTGAGLAWFGSVQAAESQQLEAVFYVR